ncbi:MAG: xanthine dehydrogenase family protein molybdopterin-binding subunit, partial [Treponema sp.]|nr:xanthine dehydrogenase family protein molybdopterin-binding subunit [Treponema sp.]
MFVGDIAVPGMIYAQTIRSPIPRGRLLSIKAPRLPGSYTLVTAADIPGKNELEGCLLPILAKDALSYIGEPVALLLGPDEVKLEDLCSRITAAVEGETPVFSGGEDDFTNRKVEIRNVPRVSGEVKTLVKGAYTTGVQEHWYAEPTGAVASFTDKKLSVSTATQWPFHVKRSVAEVLGINEDDVIIEAARTGLHLDGRVWYPSLIACQAALGALVTGHPVKLMLSRGEDLRYSPKRNAARIAIKSDLGEKGEPLGAEVEIKTELGAYGIFADELLDRGCLGALGVYRWPAVSVRGQAQKTNIPPQGPFAGFGLSQGFFAAERHVSLIADTLGVDPAEWRKKNFLRHNDKLGIGIPLKDALCPEQLLDSAASMSDYYRKWAAYELLRRRRKAAEWDNVKEPFRGVGIAVGYQGSGFLYSGKNRGNSGVELILEKDGSLEIRTGASSAEYAPIWQKLAQDILALEASQIRIKTDLSGSPDSGPASLSRNITALTKLVERCCLIIRKQRFRDPRPIVVRRQVRPVKFSPWDQKDLAADGGAFAHLGWAAAVVEVEIDTVSFCPKIRGVWLSVDGGRI